MKEMKAHGNREELLTAAISVVITLVGGIGLSILLNGFIRGFFALTAIGFVLLLIISWRRSFALKVHLRGYLPEIELVKRPQAGRGQGRKSSAD